MMQRRSMIVLATLLAVGGLPTAQPAAIELAQATATSPAAEAYLRARRAYETEAEAYWKQIADKRRVRFAKRREGKPVGLDDYVLAQPPAYTGPQRPSDFPIDKEPGPPPERIPGIDDFLKAAAEQYNFVPDRLSEAEFKRAYAKVAGAAGITRDQAVRVYAFETGGNGTYDGQAGLVGARNKDAKPISPAMGYNQLLSTNSVSLLAEKGDKFIKALRASGAAERKIATLQTMIAFSRTVPVAWSEHDKLAKTTEGGRGIHAAVLDRDIGPLLQTQKLLDSIEFARIKGYKQTLTGAELEMMNLTGDGNGIDLVMMPKELREKVPTTNFFQRHGYERNGIARRANNVAAMYTAMDAKMDQASQAQGAKELAAAF